jgi:hypothetical protein
MNALLELYRQWDDVLAAIGAIVVALQALVFGALTLARLLGRLALITQTKADDDALALLALWLGRAHDALVRAQRYIPRPRLGKPRDPLVGTSIPPPPEPQSSG